MPFRALKCKKNYPREIFLNLHFLSLHFLSLHDKVARGDCLVCGFLMADWSISCSSRPQSYASLHPKLLVQVPVYDLFYL